jgi:hypothetical protein
VERRNQNDVDNKVAQKGDARFDPHIDIQLGSFGVELSSFLDEYLATTFVESRFCES